MRYLHSRRTFLCLIPIAPDLRLHSLLFTWTGKGNIFPLLVGGHAQLNYFRLGSLSFPSMRLEKEFSFSIFLAISIFLFHQCRDLSHFRLLHWKQLLFYGADFFSETFTMIKFVSVVSIVLAISVRDAFAAKTLGNSASLVSPLHV